MMKFAQLFSESQMLTLKSLDSKVTKALSKEKSLLQFSSQVENIPEYENLKKYREDILKIQIDEIATLLHEHYLLQINAISQTCIERFDLNSNKMKQIELLIISGIGRERYEQIVEETTDYKLFKQGLYRVYLFVSLMGLVLKNKLLFTLSVLSYSVFVYSLILKKYMKYCRADVFNVAVSNAHKNNLIATYFLRGGHLAIIEYVALSEINKFLKFKRFTPKLFTRVFTYIKHRFNQAFKYFFNSTYYKYYSKYKDEIKAAKINQSTSATSTTKHLIIGDIINNHKTVSEIPHAYIDQIADSYGLDDRNFMYKFSQTYINITKDIEPILQKYYDTLFKLVPFESPSDMCRNAYYRKLATEYTSKKPDAIALKSLLDSIVDRILNKMGKYNVSITIKRQLRNYLFTINYFVFIKPVVCH